MATSNSLYGDRQVIPVPHIDLLQTVPTHRDTTLDGAHRASMTEKHFLQARAVASRPGFSGPRSPHRNKDGGARRPMRTLGRVPRPGDCIASGRSPNQSFCTPPTSDAHRPHRPHVLDRSPLASVFSQIHDPYDSDKHQRAASFQSGYMLRENMHRHVRSQYHPEDKYFLPPSVQNEIGWGISS
eukprot:5108650-Prymnesium_polylepis.1